VWIFQVERLVVNAFVLETLNLWKKKLLAPKSKPDAKSETNKPADKD
jgi:hypothetical protein